MTVNKSSSPAKKDKTSFSWKQRGQSLRYAWQGIKYAFSSQHNMWLHSAAAILAILLGLILQISHTQWYIIALCISLVLAMEMMNTAIETLIDHLHPEQHPKMGLIKDLAAGAVLVTAIVAFIIGCFIFLPRLFVIFKGWFI